MKLICIILSVLTVVFLIIGTSMYVNNVDNCRFFVSKLYGEEGTIYYKSVSDNILNPNLYIAGAFWDIALLLFVAVIITAWFYRKKVKENPEIASIKMSFLRLKERRAEKKQDRIAELMALKEEDILLRLGIIQSTFRIALIVLGVVALGCLIFFIVESIKYGIAYGFQILLICIVFVIGLLAIFGIPLYTILAQNKEITQVISMRSQESSAFANWEVKLKEKRHKSAIVLIAIISVSSIIAISAFSSGISSNSGGGGTVECGYCGRTFKSSSDDGSSIAKRKLCENCYNNMKQMEDALDKWESDHD